MNADLKERYEERAAIMHFDGGLPRVKAEALAKAEMETYAQRLKSCAVCKCAHETMAYPLLKCEHRTEYVKPDDQCVRWEEA